MIDRTAPIEKMYGIYAKKEPIGLKMNPITAMIIMMYPVA
jgi:hypothetical protein